jgi:hypothetical protein
VTGTATRARPEAGLERAVTLASGDHCRICALDLLRRKPLLGGRELVGPEYGLAQVFEEIHERARRREQAKRDS